MLMCCGAGMMIPSRLESWRNDDVDHNDGMIEKKIYIVQCLYIFHFQFFTIKEKEKQKREEFLL